MSRTITPEHATYSTLRQTLRTYGWAKAQRDLTAALTVAVVALPQSMAYAIIAGLDPVYGLYTGVVTVIIGSLTGSSSFLVTGPTNAISLLVASNMKSFMGQADAMSMVFLMTFMVGMIQIGFSLMRLGRMTRYVSHAVIVGFTCGAGVIIGLGQLNALLGISVGKGYLSVMEKLYKVATHLNETNWYALGVGAMVIVVIAAGRKISKKIPGALIGILIAIGLAKLFSLSGYGVKLTERIPSALPAFRLVQPDLEQARHLLSGALAVAIIGLVEAMSIAKSLGSIADQKVDANREFLGQGAANMAGSFFQCYPASGSFTRSAINFANGAQTRFAGAFSGLFLAVILLFFAPLVQYLPSAALAGVILFTAYTMVSPKQMRLVSSAGRTDRIVMWVTFGATILMPDLDWAIYMGIAISIILYLRDTNTVPVKLLIEPAADGEAFQEKEISYLRRPVKILTIQIEGNLYFGSSEDLERKLDSLGGKAEVFILRLKSIHAIDVTAVEVLGAFIRRVRQGGGHVLLSGVRSGIRTVLANTRLEEMVGPDCVFLSEDDTFAASRKALARARSLAGVSRGVEYSI